MERGGGGGGGGAGLGELVEAIVADDRVQVAALLDRTPALVTVQAERGATRAEAARYDLAEIEHYLYAGDTALHIAGAALLAGGVDPLLPNRSGSTPLQLAHRATGRGGSGSPAAKAEQEAIVGLLRQ